MTDLSSERAERDDPFRENPATRSRRVFWNGALVILGVAVLLLPGLAIVKIALQPRSITGRANLGEVTMPDGTVLVFDQLTLNDKHRFEFDPSRGSSIGNWLAGKGSRTTSTPSVSLSPSDGAMVVWFTRWDRATGAALDFDWWHSTVLVDETGEEVVDAKPQLISSDGTGVWSRSISRPNTDNDPHGRMIVAASQLPVVYPSSVLRRLRVYDREGTVVAEFSLPSLPERPIPSRTPEPVPSVKTDGDVAVTLEEVAIHSRNLPMPEGIMLKNPRPHWSVAPRFSVVRNGIATEDWKLEAIRLSDPLGNIVPAADCSLNVREAAWQLELTLARDTPSAFAPEEQFESELLALPAADSNLPLEIKGLVQGVDLQISAIGRGTVEYRQSLPRERLHHYSDSPALGAKSYKFSHWSHSSGSGPVTSTIEVSGDVTHLVLDLDNLPVNHRELLRVYDDQGLVLPHRLERFVSGRAARYFVIVDPPPGAQSLRLMVYVHTTRSFTWPIAPPGR